MNRSFPLEFFYQLAALFVAVIIVHAVYVALIRPEADTFLANQSAMMQEDPGYVPKRSPYVILRDFEQEACIILMFWALAIMGFKGVSALKERQLFKLDLAPKAEGARILPQDAREYQRQLQSLRPSEQVRLLPRTLAAALHRFSVTGNIQDASDTAHSLCEAASDRLESELSMVRYISWAIPSIGFIGTVRGIGEALGQAHKAVEGNIEGVTRSLGIAFNSTLVALLISIFLMFLLHQLQLHQERLVMDAEAYLDEHLIDHLQVG